MNKRKSLNLSILISLFLHVVLLVFLMFQKDKDVDPELKTAAIEWVELQTPPDLDERAQIVQQDDQSVNEKSPEKDYKLSKNDQDVLKETKAEKNGEFQNRKNQREGQAQAAKASSASQVSQREQTLNSLKPEMMNMQYHPSKMAPPAQPALSGAEVSQNDDYLKDVAAGAATLLKTREFVYYSYYNRIKSKLRHHWEPRIKEKIVKILRQGRKIASVNDKITRLVITLDQSGELVRVQVRNASGYNDLDDAAIEAFRAAAPFPNPPQGIVNGTGQVEINWDFVLET